MIVPLIAPFMHIATEDGDVEIREEDLSVITDAELRMLRISREELRRCFGEAMEMMRGATQADWVQARPVAVPLNRKWEVHAIVPGDNQDERPATIRMRMAPGVG